jgi:hypothetical protein
MAHGSNMKKKNLNDLMQIPWVGPRVAQKLWQLGFREASDLKNANPEKMYDDYCHLKGCKVDRCVLYVFRCVVYFASNKHHDPEKLKWWNWK